MKKPRKRKYIVARFGEMICVHGKIVVREDVVMVSNRYDRRDITTLFNLKDVKFNLIFIKFTE